MNEYKLAWMHHCNIHYDNSKPAVDDRTQNSIPDSLQLGLAVKKTARAVALGIAISQLDGPAPVADVLGVAVATTLSVKAWHDYLTS
jgi:hypothetical protein